MPFINQTGSAFFNKCGAPLSPPQPVKQIPVPMPVWIGLGVFAFIVVISVIIAAITSSHMTPVQVAKTEAAASPATPALDTVSSATHLAEAKKALADGYKPTGENRAWGRMKDAREHLEKIQSSDKEYGQAQKLLTEVSRRETEIDKWSKVAARKVYADLLERTYLNQGMDVSVKVSGPDNTTIKLKYVL